MIRLHAHLGIPFARDVQAPTAGARLGDLCGPAKVFVALADPVAQDAGEVLGDVLGTDESTASNDELLERP